MNWLRHRSQIDSDSILLGRVDGACPLISYTPNPNCIASISREKAVLISPGFQTSMDLICTAANTCSLQLYIVQSFRRSNAALTNTVYPPATYSNHLVGYAIDMNTVSASGRICNSGCLNQTTNLPSDVSCFLGKIRTSPPLRYGGDFSG